MLKARVVYDEHRHGRNQKAIRDLNSALNQKGPITGEELRRRLLAATRTQGAVRLNMDATRTGGKAK